MNCNRNGKRPVWVDDPEKGWRFESENCPGCRACKGETMPDNFEHKVQKIELPEPTRPAYRLSVPGGWLYAWGGGLCFVSSEETNGTNEIEDLQETIRTLTFETVSPTQHDALRYALKQIRSRSGITLKEAQKIAGTALLEDVL